MDLLTRTPVRGSIRFFVAIGASLLIVVGVLGDPGSSASTVSVLTNHANSAIVPAPPGEPAWRKRAEIVLERARDNPGPCDVLFIGDSITEFWEKSGTNVWKRYYGNRQCLNLGVSGDRTQCVLWRFERGQLDGLKPKVTVLLIGTNNSNNQDNSEAEILQGVQAIVSQIRHRLPDTKILLLGIFPRGAIFNPQRGKILQVNQALANLADGRMLHYLDVGSRFLELDGSISSTIMPDFLHLSERGYEIWAGAMEPELQKMLR